MPRIQCPRHALPRCSMHSRHLRPHYASMNYQLQRSSGLTLIRHLLLPPACCPAVPAAAVKYCPPNMWGSVSHKKLTVPEAVLLELFQTTCLFCLAVRMLACHMHIPCIHALACGNSVSRVGSAVTASSDDKRTAQRRRNAATVASAIPLVAAAVVATPPSSTWWYMCLFVFRVVRSACAAATASPTASMQISSSMQKFWWLRLTYENCPSQYWMKCRVSLAVTSDIVTVLIATVPRASMLLSAWGWHRQPELSCGQANPSQQHASTAFHAVCSMHVRPARAT